MAEAISQLRYTQNDRSQDVRRTFYEVLSFWMTKMEINSLRTFEPHFILFLLNGLSDECEDIAKMCKAFLEEHGTRMKQALAALGEDEDQEMKDAEESEPT